jgi:hypothetical protein
MLIRLIRPAVTSRPELTGSGKAAERTYRPRQAREAASRWCGDALPRPGPAADPACPPPRRTYHPDHTGTWCPSRRQPLPIPFVLAVSLARVYRHHPAAHGGPSGPHGTASYARQASAREECRSSAADYCSGWTTRSSALVRALGSSQTHWPSKRAERRHMHEVVSGRSSLRHDEIKAALVAFICARMTSSAVPIVRYVE